MKLFTISAAASSSRLRLLSALANPRGSFWASTTATSQSPLLCLQRHIATLGVVAFSSRPKLAVNWPQTAESHHHPQQQAPQQQQHQPQPQSQQQDISHASNESTLHDTQSKSEHHHHSSSSSLNAVTGGNSDNGNNNNNNSGIGQRYLGDPLPESDQESNDPNKRPSLNRLLFVRHNLTNTLPHFFDKSHRYEIYTADLIFENFYSEPPKTTVGVMPYAMFLTYMRFKAHWHFTRVKLDVLKITCDESEGTVKVRWRVNGIRALKTMLTPWRVFSWKPKQSAEREAQWYDGFSVLSVRGDGLIYKHRMQRVISQKDEEADVLKKKVKLGVQVDVGPTMFKSPTTTKIND